MRSSVAAISMLVLTACGPAPTPQTSAPQAELQPAAVLMEIGRASSIRGLFENPQTDAETLAEQLDDASEADRERLVWDLVRARLALLEEAHSSRSDLQSAVGDAIQERARGLAAIRGRRADTERRARERAEAAEVERQAAETRSREREEAETAEQLRRAAGAREQARQDAEASERTRRQTQSRRQARSRRQSQSRSQPPPDDGADAAEVERRRRDEEFRRRAEQSRGAPQETERSDDQRERERERRDAAFQRRVEAAEERRRRRAAGGNKGAGDEGAGEQVRDGSSPKQSTRRRRRARRARRRRRARAARGGRRPRRTESRSRPDAEPEREASVDPAEELLDDDDREEFEVFVQRERDARRQLEQAEGTIHDEWEALDRLARRLGRLHVSEELSTRVEFALLWAAWRTGHASAAERSERFTDEHPGAGDLLALAWMIRGEVAATEMQPEASLAAFRFGMNRLGEPLYAYSLWRSASVQRDAGDDASARESLLGVEQEGCAREAPELSRRLSYAAASALDHEVRVDPDGVTRPESCTVQEEREESTGWRPEE